MSVRNGRISCCGFAIKNTNKVAPLHLFIRIFLFPPEPSLGEWVLACPPGFKSRLTGADEVWVSEKVEAGSEAGYSPVRHRPPPSVVLLVLLSGVLRNETPLLSLMRTGLLRSGLFFSVYYIEPPRFSKLKILHIGTSVKNVTPLITTQRGSKQISDSCGSATTMRGPPGPVSCGISGSSWVQKAAFSWQMPPKKRHVLEAQLLLPRLTR